MRDIKALPTRYSLHLMNASDEDGNCFEAFLTVPIHATSIINMPTLLN